ncbi:MAG: hypothetical protein LBD04_01975 [Synergistaceae bacterium]|jgi:D-serine deaminase-like pyridoxal phosphate-dependent protein|nr:hypothetical protein [Synergistaceae bacterium]
MHLMYDFPTPAVAVDLDIVEKNVRDMTLGLSKYGIAHRPHIKTHRSVELAKLQLSLGARNHLREARRNGDNGGGGIDDILIAFPIIGEDKLKRYGALSERCSLRSIVNSQFGARGLSGLGRRLGKKLGVRERKEMNFRGKFEAQRQYYPTLGYRAFLNTAQSGLIPTYAGEAMCAATFATAF